jgi:hypothetical protein
MRCAGWFLNQSTYLMTKNWPSRRIMGTDTTGANSGSDIAASEGRCILCRVSSKEISLLCLE